MSEAIGTLTPRRLTHANLWVSDLAAATDFYRSVVGFEKADGRVPVPEPESIDLVLGLHVGKPYLHHGRRSVRAMHRCHP